MATNLVRAWGSPCCCLVLLLLGPCPSCQLRLLRWDQVAAGAVVGLHHGRNPKHYLHHEGVVVGLAVGMHLRGSGALLHDNVIPFMGAISATNDRLRIGRRHHHASPRRQGKTSAVSAPYQDVEVCGLGPGELLQRATDGHVGVDILASLQEQLDGGHKIGDLLCHALVSLVRAGGHSSSEHHPTACAACTTPHTALPLAEQITKQRVTPLHGGGAPQAPRKSTC